MNLRLVLMAVSTTPPYGVPDRDAETYGTHPATRQQKLSFPIASFLVKLRVS